MNTIFGATLRWDVAKGHLSSKGSRSRDSQATTPYKIIDQYHERFEREWEPRYQERYGYLRLSSPGLIPENTLIVAFMIGGVLAQSAQIATIQ